MSERNMRQSLVKQMKKVHAISVENPAFPGTPDINTSVGWLELKELDEWPRREGTIVRIEHFTQQQRVWLLKRWKVSNSSWLLLKVKNEWLLFSGDVAYKDTVIGALCRNNLYRAAHKYWSHGIDVNELLRIMFYFKLEGMKELEMNLDRSSHE